MRLAKRSISIFLFCLLLFTSIKVIHPSAALETLELRNLASGLSYEYSEEPDLAFPDTGNKLTDGIYANLDMDDPAWVGHVKKKTREVVFDLGEKKSIASIKAHFMQDWPTNSILVPLTVSMYVSDDKENWGTLSHNATQLLWGDGPPREEYYVWNGEEDGIRSGNIEAEMAYARYVKVTFSMHTRAHTFIDEIEIWGTDGQVEGAVTVPAEQFEYLQPGEATAGINDLVLLYNGHYPEEKGIWEKDRIIPNISYVGQDGEPQDWFYDGVLYLGLTSLEGRGFGGGALLKDWNWYLDKTFADQGDMQQLNEATKEVGAKLNESDHKVKVVLMIPDPGEYITDFGDVDGDGVSENFNASEVGKEKAVENRVKVVNWWIEEVIQRWQKENYTNLDLVGLYWLEEQISTSDTGPEVIKDVSKLVHEKNLQFFWIPHFLAYKSYMWDDVDFDAVAFQPNYFFEEMEPDRLEDAANIAKRYGMGVEMEFDDRMLTNGVFRERYIDYLNGGVQYGYMNDSFKAYYQGNDAIYGSAVSKDPATRILYDWLYQFVNGTYEINEEMAPEVDVKINDEILLSEFTISDAEPFKFNWNVRGGNEMASVTATFDGKPYEEGTILDLAGKPGKYELVVTATAGKMKKTTYLIQVTPSAASMKKLVDRFAKDGEFKNQGATRSLQVHLEALTRFEDIDASEKVRKHLKGFNVLLEHQIKEQLISEKAYEILKADTYYLIGNLALNKNTESSEVEGARPELTSDKAVDGIESTRWSSTYSDNAWFLVDLGESTKIDTVTINWENAYGKRYKILVSDDKEQWTNVFKDNEGIIDGRGGKETIQFDEVNARYVKFQGVERATDYGYSFYEFAVYHLGN